VLSKTVQRLTFMYKILNGQVAVPAESIDLKYDWDAEIGM